MQLLRYSLWFIAILACLTGAMDILVGATAQANIGIALSKDQLLDPVLNSQIHFLGAIWFGYGLLLIYGLQDLGQRASLVAGALGFLILGGIGRLIAIAQSGVPESTAGIGFIIFALVVELLLAPVQVIALRRISSSQGE
ncbi:DUF4345 domain-containing protein [Spongiibacter nanhainus]|uniref:DUF4345 domain-containing protein n=1 Tax=Spongiibacter nanhainus TaxID=2794344 RepID=A0A7T4URE9_9GAMM|nr:DUF4345 domain-containing protein [Spongiibacter nanhainus]QQD19148.1 DUF4345 domain-containing protein [Spongiibacter nanhainus]